MFSIPKISGLLATELAAKTNTVNIRSFSFGKSKVLGAGRMGSIKITDLKTSD